MGVLPLGGLVASPLSREGRRYLGTCRHFLGSRGYLI